MKKSRICRVLLAAAFALAVIGILVVNKKIKITPLFAGKFAVDVEFYGDKSVDPPPKEEVVKQLRELLAALEEQYRVKPVIYTTYQAYHRYIENELEEYPLWIRNVYYQPFMTADAWTFWQYTDTAVLEGYQGEETYIDRNVFRGTKEELWKLTTME